ncbi:MAG: ComF family protein [Actinobacteria bacterium]|nr:ComF family protein [Actinomycetota bacterium]
MRQSTITDFFKDIIIPPLCAVCGKLSHEIVCSSCRAAIETVDSPICIRCGSPVPGSVQNVENCSQCRDQGYAFYRHRSFSLYRGNMKRLIQGFKYDRVYEIGKLLANFLYEAYLKYYHGYMVDYIYIVPGRHIELLAERLSSLSGIPFVDNIIKIRDIYRQQGLGYYQRRENVRESFKIRDCLAASGRNILLIDDVWTTGSTLKEICRVLSESNTGKIFILTLARGN